MDIVEDDIPLVFVNDCMVHVDVLQVPPLVVTVHPFVPSHLSTVFPDLV